MTDAIEFTTAGARTLADDTLRVTIDIEPRDAHKAFQMFGQRGLRGAMVRLKDHPEPDDTHGHFWRDLIASGVFRARRVLKSIGKESDYEKWITTLPSVLNGDADYDPDTGDIRNECCHVRRVSEGAGTAEKPPYFAVPMTHKEHQHQHQHGEKSAMMAFGRRDWDPEWFQRKADQLRADWASHHLAWQLKPGCKSRAEVPPADVIAWFEKHDLSQYLPNKLKGKLE